MAGAGRKVFQFNEILTAVDVNQYLMDQSVMRFADSAARSSAIGTPTEGMVSWLDDVDQVEVYDGSGWVNFTGDINQVTAGTALTGGGTEGNVTLDVDTAAVGSAISITASEISDVTATATELNILDGVTATSAELNILDGVTATASEINILDGVTADATELNLLDGVTATTTELNYVDGVTSGIQSQLDGKVDETNGAVTTAATGSAVVRNIHLSTSTPSSGDGIDGDVWLVYTP